MNSIHKFPIYAIIILDIAGANRKIFEEEAFDLIRENSGGIPRRINHICDMSLLVGFSKGVGLISDDIANDVVKDLES